MPSYPIPLPIPVMSKGRWGGRAAEGSGPGRIRHFRSELNIFFTDLIIKEMILVPLLVLYVKFLQNLSHRLSFSI